MVDIRHSLVVTGGSHPSGENTGEELVTDMSESLRVEEVLTGLYQRMDRKGEVAEVPVKVGNDRGAGLSRGGRGEKRLFTPYAQQRVHVGQWVGCDSL